MPDRLEWQLVPLVREDQREVVEVLAEQALALDTMMELTPHRMTPVDQQKLLDLQRRIEKCVESPCEAAAAPPVRARTSWAADARELLGGLAGSSGVPEEKLLSRLGEEPDCMRCPGASRFPGVSGMPCDFDLTPLSSLVDDRDTLEQVQFELTPSEMLALAARLDAHRVDGWYSKSPEVDGEEYLLDASKFLRFWAQKGFGVAPAYVTAEEEEEESLG